MTNKQVVFSKFPPKEFEQICELLCSLFETTPEVFHQVYQDIDRDFDKPDWPMQYLPREIFRSCDPKFQEIYLRSPVVATDLPSSMEWDDGNDKKPTVVILGQDSKHQQSYKDLVVGTPYGLHHKGTREKLRITKIYFEMFQEIMDLGYRVYLTDIWKIWVCNPDNPYKGKTPRKGDRQRFFDILRRELDIVSPTAIITWGKPASNTVCALNFNLKHIAMPHPSGANGGAWKKLIGNASEEGKRAYWQNKILTELGQ